MVELLPQMCAGCTITFQPKRKDQLFHDKACYKRSEYRAAHKLPPPRSCPGCSQDFTPRRTNQVFCSVRCRIAKWESEHPRVAIEKLEALTQPEATASTVATGMPVPRPLYTRRPPPRSPRFCQRPGCGKHVRYDSDRFCSTAHQIADLQDSIRERAQKKANRKQQKAAAKNFSLQTA